MASEEPWLRVVDSFFASLDSASTVAEFSKSHCAKLATFAEPYGNLLLLESFMSASIGGGALNKSTVASRLLATGRAAYACAKGLIGGNASVFTFFFELLESKWVLVHISRTQGSNELGQESTRAQRDAHGVAEAVDGFDIDAATKPVKAFQDQHDLSKWKSTMTDETTLVRPSGATGGYKAFHVNATQSGDMQWLHSEVLKIGHVRPLAGGNSALLRCKCAQTFLWKGSPVNDVAQIVFLVSRPSAEMPFVIEAVHRHSGMKGTTLLQMQIGFVRLINGAAYRVFRGSYAANHFTHESAKDYPYTLRNFVDFTRAAVGLFIDLAGDSGLDVESLNGLVGVLQQQLDRLLLGNGNAAAAAATETMPPWLGKDGEDATEAATEAAAVFQSREEILLSELSEERPNGFDGATHGYIDKSEVVHVDENTQAPMPIRWWYDTFEPLLLRAFSVSRGSGSGADPADAPLEVEHSDESPAVAAGAEAWYASAVARGEFKVFGCDLAEAWSGGGLSVPQKLAAMRAWRFTRHYLNGVQKKRERGGSAASGTDHRFTGDMSMYVPFLDLSLSRSYVEHSEMRVSFPYFLGPSTWTLFHTTAEAACAASAATQSSIVASFKAMLLHFPSVYACPYCRHHMNEYVFRNGELELYPIEWILLGCSDNGSIATTVADKLAAVANGPALRLFLWKLHNAVSSSIARQEQWYQRDKLALYTNRFYPSIESEMSRAAALGSQSMPRARVEAVFATTKPSVALGLLRHDLIDAAATEDGARLRGIVAAAAPLIAQLDEALVASKFLCQFEFNPNKGEANPAFSAEEEEYARGGVFEVL